MKPKLAFPFLFAAIVALAACEPTVAERGNLVDPDKLATLKVGDSKEVVVQALGSPTTVGAFDASDWYYMGQRTEQESFFEPEVTERRIVEITFSDDDKVANIKQYGKDDAEPVSMDDTTTPPQGRETTLEENLFGRGGFGSDKLTKKKKDTN